MLLPVEEAVDFDDDEEEDEEDEDERWCVCL